MNGFELTFAITHTTRNVLGRQALETTFSLCATHLRLYFIIYAESPCWRSMLALKLRKSIKLPTTMRADNSSSSSCSLHRQLYRFFCVSSWTISVSPWIILSQSLSARNSLCFSFNYFWYLLVFFLSLSLIISQHTRIRQINKISEKLNCETICDQFLHLYCLLEQSKTV